MLKPVVWSQPFVWIPLKASTNEVYEGWVRELSQLAHDVAESFLLLIVCQHLQRSWDSIVLELCEEPLSLGIFKDLL